MKAAHYLFALATLIIGLLIGLNIKKNKDDDYGLKRSSVISNPELRAGMNEWYGSLDKVPAYFILTRENFKTVNSLLHKIEHEHNAQKAVVSFGNYNGEQRLMMASYDEQDTFIAAFVINDPVDRCPYVCDLSLIDHIREIEDVKLPVADEDPAPEEPK